MRVQCRELRVTVGDVVLLPETTFTVEHAGFIALTGANGAGKTTLLRTLAGRQFPTAGECLIRGTAPYEFDPQFRAAVASLIDTPPMARDMTLTEQLTLVHASWGLELEEAISAAGNVLTRLSIGELSDRFPYELSSGQLQLFGMALTLSRPFELLLLDEPERHLDGDRIQDLLDLLQERVDGGALIITATHRQEIIEGSTRRIHLERQAAA